jgi:hypothetical protein
MATFLMNPITGKLVTDTLSLARLERHQAASTDVKTTLDSSTTTKHATLGYLLQGTEKSEAPDRRESARAVPGAQTTSTTITLTKPARLLVATPPLIMERTTELARLEWRLVVPPAEAHLQEELCYRKQLTVAPASLATTSAPPSPAQTEVPTSRTAPGAREKHGREESMISTGGVKEPTPVSSATKEQGTRRRRPCRKGLLVEEPPPARDPEFEPVPPEPPPEPPPSCLSTHWPYTVDKKAPTVEREIWNDHDLQSTYTLKAVWPSLDLRAPPIKELREPRATTCSTALGAQTSSILSGRGDDTSVSRMRSRSGQDRRNPTDNELDHAHRRWQVSTPDDPKVGTTSRSDWGQSDAQQEDTSSFSPDTRAEQPSTTSTGSTITIADQIIGDGTGAPTASRVATTTSAPATISTVVVVPDHSVNPLDDQGTRYCTLPLPPSDRPARPNLTS